MEAVAPQATIADVRPASVVRRLDRPTTALLLVFVGMGATGLVTYLESYDRETLSALLLVWLLTATVQLLWIGAWSSVNRVATGRWKFFAHTGIAFGFLVVDFAVAAAKEYIEFALSTGSTFEVAWIVVLVAVFAAQVTLHLQQFSNSSMAKQVAASALVGTLLIGGGYAVFWARPSWLPTRVSFASNLKPLPVDWLPTESASSFLDRLDGLRAKVDRQARELEDAERHHHD